ncbi:hypothetical protein IEQ34_021798 [Dendrobium chrysotoxum]|uniref:Transmembrane protein n=1 Tax=Dendrobium chrysotoxum TaxID=161865 RepID=A0AAV7G411_DENCH|nr:hypothetical protein IEQ34_021798 [Dendrobium chrysotoxum]
MDMQNTQRRCVFQKRKSGSVGKVKWLGTTDNNPNSTPKTQVILRIGILLILHFLVLLRVPWIVRSRYPRSRKALKI